MDRQDSLRRLGRIHWPAPYYSPRRTHDTHDTHPHYLPAVREFIWCCDALRSGAADTNLVLRLPSHSNFPYHDIHLRRRSSCWLNRQQSCVSGSLAR
jgi:hypothetical protein